MKQLHITTARRPSLNQEQDDIIPITGKHLLMVIAVLVSIYPLAWAITWIAMELQKLR